MIRIGTDCSGIGSPEEAFKRLGEEYEVVFGCERDKWARMVYEANHKCGMMFEDMTSRDNGSAELDVDLYVAGIPCQSFSLAGKRLGESDARGTLFYNFWDFVKQRRPKVFMIENVPGLLSDKKGRTFRNWLEMLGRTINYQEQLHLHEDNLGYNLHWRKLNSVDFGVPQNRERVFLIGIRGDLENRFTWPAGVKLEKTVKDILEDEVDEKYYLSEQAMKRLLQVSPDLGEGIVVNDNGRLRETDAFMCVDANYHKGMDNHSQRSMVVESDPYVVQGSELRLTGKLTKRDIVPTLKSETKKGDSEPVVVEAGRVIGRNPENPTSRKAGENTEQMLEINERPGITNTVTTVQKDNVIALKFVGGIGDPTWNKDGEGLSRDFSQGNRVYDADGLACTLASSAGGLGGKSGLYKVERRIRRLTPLECFRLQGFGDEFKKPVSDSQLYRCAGNTITVNVLEALFRQLLPILKG